MKLSEIANTPAKEITDPKDLWPLLKKDTGEAYTFRGLKFINNEINKRRADDFVAVDTENGDMLIIFHDMGKPYYVQHSLPGDEFEVRGEVIDYLVYGQSNSMDPDHQNFIYDLEDFEGSEEERKTHVVKYLLTLMKKLSRPDDVMGIIAVLKHKGYDYPEFDAILKSLSAKKNIQ